MRRLLLGIAALLVLIVLGSWAFIKFRLSLNGVTRPVTLTVSGRRDGTALQIAGSIPVAFSRWDINGPGGLGFLGSLADHGVAEFLLTLNQR